MKYYLNIIGTVIGYIALISVFIAMIAVIPMGIIWVINELFGIEIPYTWKTWLGIVFILALFERSSK